MEHKHKSQTLLASTADIFHVVLDAAIGRAPCGYLSARRVAVFAVHEKGFVGLQFFFQLHVVVWSEC